MPQRAMRPRRPRQDEGTRDAWCARTLAELPLCGGSACGGLPQPGGRTIADVLVAPEARFGKLCYLPGRVVDTAAVAAVLDLEIAWRHQIEREHPVVGVAS